MLFTQSLKKNFQFRYVYHKGRSFANRRLVMYIIKNGTAENRLGISVSKKVGKSVVRSHVTRLIRESYRSMEAELKRGYDIVVIARVSCNEASYWEVRDSLRHLMKKHNFFCPEEAEKSEMICSYGKKSIFVSHSFVSAGDLPLYRAPLPFYPHLFQIRL